MNGSTTILMPALWAGWVLWCLQPWRAPARRAPATPVGAAAPAARAQVRRATRRAIRTGLAVCGVVAAGASLGLAAAALVLVWAVVWPTVRRRRVRRRDVQRAAACVPDVGELLRIGVAAGLTPVLAMEQLAELAPGPGRAAACDVLVALDRGRPLADALPILIERLGPGVRPLVDALAATERYGVPLDPVLDAAVADLRRQRRTQAAAAARRLPVSLSFPLVGCVLPAFALLTLAPLVAGAFGSLRAGVPTTTGSAAHAGAAGQVPGSSSLGPAGSRPTAPAGGQHDASNPLTLTLTLAPNADSNAGP